MKSSTDTIGNRTRDLPAFSAVPQPTASCWLTSAQTTDYGADGGEAVDGDNQSWGMLGLQQQRVPPHLTDTP